MTRPYTLEATFGGVAVFPVDGRLHAAFEASTAVRRKDFGLGFGAMGAALGAVVEVDIDIELVGPETAAQAPGPRGHGRCQAPSVDPTL